MHVEFIDKENRLTSEQHSLLKNVLVHAYNVEKFTNSVEVAISIVSDEEIQKLNYEYRGKNVPTDVLSFTSYSRKSIEEADFSTFPLPIGDIIISFDRAKEQAIEYNHSLDRELAFLAVHGFLHLVGYKHDSEADEKVMFAKQEQILKEFNLERR